MASFAHPEKVLRHIFHHRRLQTIEPGVLTVSCYANFYPVCYKTKRGAIVGLDVDIMKAFCKLTGLKLKLIEKEMFDGIWFDPVYEISDVAIGGIGITKNRTAPGMSWSIPYFYVDRTLVYNKRNPIRKIPDDISGPIRATEGSTGLYDAAKWEQMMEVLEPGKTDEEDIQDLLQSASA